MTESTAPVTPLAGTLVPPSAAPLAPPPCRNCGSAMVRDFCADCGQRAVDPDPTLRELGSELAESFANFDRRLGATLRLLFTRPGALTQEYLAGRRAPYWSPLRLYLAASVVFFSLAALVPTPRAELAQLKEQNVLHLGPLSVQLSADTAADQKAFAAWARSENPFVAHVGRAASDALRDPLRLLGHVTAMLPRMMFVLVPLFAALMQLVFRRGPYPKHLVFALHLLAFAYVALLLPVAGKLAAARAAMSISLELALAACLVYATLAARRFYAVSVGAAAARLVAVGLLYFAALVAATLATVAVAALV